MSMSQIERNNLAQTIKNMSKEEKEIVVRNLPIQLCYNRVGEELQKQRAAIKKLGEVMRDLSGSYEEEEVKGIGEILDDILKAN